MEGMRLRVKDVDFAQGAMVICDGKGAKDRVTMLPQAVAEHLRLHLRRRAVFEDDLRRGNSSVYLPHALERTSPAASRSWPWPHVFVSGCYSNSIGHADVATTMILRMR